MHSILDMRSWIQYFTVFYSIFAGQYVAIYVLTILTNLVMVILDSIKDKWLLSQQSDTVGWTACLEILIGTFEYFSSPSFPNGAGATQSYIQWVLGAVSPRYEAATVWIYLPPSSAKHLEWMKLHFSASSIAAWNEL
jgi:hypothetical protein